MRKFPKKEVKEMTYQLLKAALILIGGLALTIAIWAPIWLSIGS
jgi:hypothetical protein